MPSISSTSSGSLYSLAGRRKYLTPPERADFIAAAMACPRPELRTFCLVLAYTGCRISEALALQAASINPSEGFVAVVTLKKRARWVVREVPLPELLVEMLADVHGLESAAADAPLWTWCRSRAWQLVKEVMAEAGIDAGLHATPKGLRHGFGLHAVRSGVPINLVQRWLGHARLETTSIYLNALGDEEREIAMRMWTKLDARATLRQRIGRFIPMLANWTRGALRFGFQHLARRLPGSLKAQCFLHTAAAPDRRLGAIFKSSGG